LKTLRNEKGVTQQEIADYLGITRAAFANIENGKRETDFSTIIKLSNFFNVTIDYLFGLTHDPTPPDEKKEAPLGLTPSEAAKAYFLTEKGREPTEDELRIFLATAQGLFSTLPNKADQT
jgi:transcriptional regulator with XRE-family HTH domain